MFKKYPRRPKFNLSCPRSHPRAQSPLYCVLEVPPKPKSPIYSPSGFQNFNASPTQMQELQSGQASRPASLTWKALSFKSPVLSIIQFIISQMFIQSPQV
ncbi:hypothetical protein CDAR_598231 [Caerostris darwini]|uniref:Uncharacterized protein n=1 Tax=Caerostris darwini TaxID=1538125 RepID=A0AAV4QMW1_9ARAC|nr:hypothetical protein CDAR_598231 [Caerostris darwini]